MEPDVPELLLVPALPLEPEGIVDVELPEAPMPDDVREDEEPEGVAEDDVPPEGLAVTDEPDGDTLPLTEPPVDPMPEAVPDADPEAPGLPQAARAAAHATVASSLIMLFSLDSRADARATNFAVEPWMVLSPMSQCWRGSPGHLPVGLVLRAERTRLARAADGCPTAEPWRRSDKRAMTTPPQLDVLLHSWTHLHRCHEVLCRDYLRSMSRFEVAKAREAAERMTAVAEEILKVEQEMAPLLAKSAV